MAAPYKMKGSPMQRNFGIGSPLKETSPIKGVKVKPRQGSSGEKSKKQANLLKVVPNKKAYNKLSDVDKKAFTKIGIRAGLPTKKSTPIKQVPGDTGDKKIMQESSSAERRRGNADVVFTKGARSHAGSDRTSERGKKTSYYKKDDGSYHKTVSRKKKGSAAGAESWETKKVKKISSKRAERQIKRKSKRHTKA